MSVNQVFTYLQLRILYILYTLPRTYIDYAISVIEATQFAFDWHALVLLHFIAYQPLWVI